LPGPYSGNSQFVEVIVSIPVQTLLIQALGVNGSQAAQARAVAGYISISAGEGVAVLDPTAIPGLQVQGGATLYVNGRVVVNSQGKGVDENNQTVDLGYAQYAASTGNNSLVQATNIEVVGGVDTPANYQNVQGNNGSPLHCRSFPEPDRLQSLPTPTTGNGAVNQFWQVDKSGNIVSASQASDVKLTVSSGATYTLSPGVYRTIDIQGGGPGTVTFSPGIYVLGVGFSGNGTTLNITTGATVTGNGVMFYNTSSDFNVTTGLPDSSDGTSKGTPAGSIGSVNISGSAITLRPLNDASSPFYGMSFYQRRWNDKLVSIQGNSSNDYFGGTLYGKWAQFSVSGSGQYNAQFICGSIKVTGQATVTINYAGKQLGKANEVFLVE
jgi:hypothetical protein